MLQQLKHQEKMLEFASAALATKGNDMTTKVCESENIKKKELKSFINTEGIAYDIIKEIMEIWNDIWF